MAKFMAILHYVYLLLKMPTEHRVLSLRGSVQAAYNCETESYAAAEAVDLSLRMQESIANSKKLGLEDLEIPTREVGRSSTKAKDFKEVELVPGDRTKTARIGPNLDPK